MLEKTTRGGKDNEKLRKEGEERDTDRQTLKRSRERQRRLLRADIIISTAASGSTIRSLA